MNFIEVAQVNQVALGAMQSFPARDKQILIANYDGKYYAIDNKCPHEGTNLSDGKLEGKIVTCPHHGSKFDVTTGSCISGPKIGFLRLKAKNALHYEVKVDGNSIKVDIHD